MRACASVCFVALLHFARGCAWTAREMQGAGNKHMHPSALAGARGGRPE